MKAINKITIGLTALAIITACSENHEPTIGVSSPESEDKLQLAETLFCAATSDELRNYSHPFSSELDSWQATFEDIYENSQQQVNSFKELDGAAIETRLDTISAQTKTTLALLNKNGNSGAVSSFIAQTMGQCTNFVS